VQERVHGTSRVHPQQLPGEGPRYTALVRKF
jgi:hypothetical protein